MSVRRSTLGLISVVVVLGLMPSSAHAKPGQQNVFTAPYSTSDPAPTRTLPPASDQEPDWARVAAVAEMYGCELLG